METSKQVRMCETYAGISETELARRLDTSPQALGQKLKRNTLTPSDLALVAAAIGATYHSYFVFPDGHIIE